MVCDDGPGSGRQFKAHFVQRMGEVCLLKPLTNRQNTVMEHDQKDLNASAARESLVKTTARPEKGARHLNAYAVRRGTTGPPALRLAPVLILAMIDDCKREGLCLMADASLSGARIARKLSVHRGMKLLSPHVSKGTVQQRRAILGAGFDSRRPFEKRQRLSI